MAGTQNFFALLGDDESEDFQALATKIAGPTPAPPAAKAPASSSAVKTPYKPSLSAAPTPTPTPDPAASSIARGRGGSRGRGGERGAYRPHGNRFTSGEFNEGDGGVEKSANGVSNGEGGRGYGGGRGRGGRGRGYYGNRGEGGEERRPRREYERQSGTGRGNEIKRHGAGAANWGVEGEVLPSEEVADVEVEKAEVEVAGDAQTEDVKIDAEGAGDEKKEAEKKEEEEEDKEMTLKEYEALREEKRKALLANKTESRKVEDKVFETMTKVTKAAEEELVLYKLGPEKSSKKKGEEDEDKELRPKTININEFLKPAEGENYYPPRRGGRGGGRGERRGGRGGNRGGYSGPRSNAASQINTNDTAQFPTLGK